MLTSSLSLSDSIILLRCVLVLKGVWVKVVCRSFDDVAGMCLLVLSSPLSTCNSQSAACMAMYVSLNCCWQTGHVACLSSDNSGDSQESTSAVSSISVRSMTLQDSNFMLSSMVVISLCNMQLWVCKHQSCLHKNCYVFSTLCCHNSHISFANKTKITSHVYKLMGNH